MKSRQVGFVLMALIAVGIAGLIVRVVSSGSDELVLKGLMPLAADVVDKVTIRTDDSEAELVRTGDAWRVARYPAFDPMLSQFWTAVADIDGAQLIGTNPDNHQRLGVAKGQGIVVSFYLGPAIQEQFVVSSKWDPDVRLCYLRRSGKDEVYGIPCLRSEVFDPDPDGWRNPVVVAIPKDEVESITFTYPDEEFVLRSGDRNWFVVSGEKEQLADLYEVDGVLTSLEVLVSTGFASDEEAKGVRFDGPDSLSVRVVTKSGAATPTTRLWFLERDDSSYYLKTPTQATVFLLDKIIADRLLKHKDDLVYDDAG